MTETTTNEDEQTTEVTRAELEAVAAGALEPEDLLGDRPPSGPTRRSLLQAAGAASAGGLLSALGVVGLSGGSSAQGQGQLGEVGDPIPAAYLDQLRGPISDTGGPIEQLVDIRVEEEEADIEPDEDTLVIRYDPDVGV